MKKHILLIKTSVITTIAIAMLSSCSSKKEKKEIIIETPVQVTITLPQSGGKQGIEVSGQIEAKQTVNISTRVMGFITKITVKTGDKVQKGQLLATISNQDIQAKKAQADAMIQEAEIAFKNAQKDKERFDALDKVGNATAKEMENINMQFNSSKSRLEMARQMSNEAKAMLAYTNLEAPISGIITQKLADEGSMANPGMPLLTIEQNGSFQASVSVPETNIGLIKEGEKASLNIKSINKTITGTITQISSSSKTTGGQYIVKIVLSEKDSKGLYSGMYVNATIETKEKVKDTNSGLILIPVSSIVHQDQLTGIYTVSSANTAQLRWLRLGKTFGDKVEVISGLDTNEPIIVQTQEKLYNGRPVEVSK